jgi:hypothetical protein
MGRCEEMCIQSPQTAGGQERRSKQMSINPADSLSEQPMLIYEGENLFVVRRDR